jgi:Bacterial regulatory protein, arsR family
VNRLRIVQRLARGEARVTDLIGQVGLSQPLVSWHLGRLRLANLVETRRSGRETICRLIPGAFEAFVASERVALGLAAPAGPGARDPTNGGNGTSNGKAANGGRGSESTRKQSAVVS